MTLTKKLISQLAKGVSYRVKPNIPEKGEMFEITIKCSNPSFLNALKFFISGGTVKGQLRTINFERYKVKALLGTIVNENSSIFFQKDLIDKGEVVLKNVPNQDYQVLCDVIENNYRNFIEKTIDLLIKNEQEFDCSVTIDFESIQKPKAVEKEVTAKVGFIDEAGLANIQHDPLRDLLVQLPHEYSRIITDFRTTRLLGRANQYHIRLNTNRLLMYEEGRLSLNRLMTDMGVDVVRAQRTRVVTGAGTMRVRR